MKRCLTCKNKYHCLLPIDEDCCVVTGMSFSDIKKCCFPQKFKEWELQAKRAGYYLTTEKMVAMT